MFMGKKRVSINDCGISLGHQLQATQILAEEDLWKADGVAHRDVGKLGESDLKMDKNKGRLHSPNHRQNHTSV